MDAVPRTNTAERYKSFALEAADGGSTMYENLANSIAGDADLLYVIDQLPSIKRQPNLLLAATQFLSGPIQNFDSFKNWALSNWEEVTEVIKNRMTQTNEVGRCATLLPLLSQLPGPLALLEVGASAGLCLYPDRYQYQYGNGRIGPADSPLVLKCETNGEVPIPNSVPDVIWRGGIDLNPLDLTDPTHFRWLESLVWPGQQERLQRLQMAANIVKADPPAIVKGDLNDGLLALVDTVPQDATLVIFHSAVLTYLSQKQRETFVEMVRYVRGHWISNEGPKVLPEIARGLPERPIGAPVRFLMALDGKPMAWTAPHGQSMEWLTKTG